MDLTGFFEQNRRIAIAFSGGTDSVYLMYEAVRAEVDVKAYCVRSAFQPAFEHEDALRMAELIGCPVEMIYADILSDERIRSNQEDRCYHCKKLIMSTILKAARSDGYEVICDGTNASDDLSERPGSRALVELGIVSPLRECGLTKSEIRRRSGAAGLPVWDKPAYSCLATRIHTGEEITSDKLMITEIAENLLHSMGFSDLRIRMKGRSALVQIREDQHEKAVLMADDILKELSAMYDDAAIDEDPRRLSEDMRICVDLGDIKH